MGSFEDIFGDYFDAYKTTSTYKDQSKMEIMFRRQEFEKILDDMWLNYSKGMVHSCLIIISSLIVLKAAD